MAEPVLDQPRVVASISHGIAASVAQHLGVDPKRQLGQPQLPPFFSAGELHLHHPFRVASWLDAVAPGISTNSAMTPRTGSRRERPASAVNGPSGPRGAASRKKAAARQLRVIIDDFRRLLHVGSPSDRVRFVASATEARDQ
jgi:hypothetical protein